MNANNSVFVICVEGITYLLLYNFHGCTTRVRKCQTYLILDLNGIINSKHFLVLISQAYHKLSEIRVS